MTISSILQWVCIPFAWWHPAVEPIQWTDWTEEWMGDIGGGWWYWFYADYFLLLTFGGIPWQASRKCFYCLLMEKHGNINNVSLAGLLPKSAVEQICCHC